MISRNRKAKVFFVGIILSTLLLSVSVPATTSITGKIVAVDEQANIAITLPEGQPVPGIGDRVELTRPAKGHSPTVNLVGTWTVTEVNGSLIYAGLQKLSGEDWPRMNEEVDIFLSDARAEKKQVSPISTNKSYAERLRIKCEQGDNPACVDLGLMYERGDRVMKSGPEAVKLIKAAAERGYARAQYELSILYRHPVGSKKSNTFTTMGMLKYEEMLALSEKWLTRAADHGNAEAQATLGHHNVTIDISKAEKWFLKAAEQGHSEAQYTLGLLYADYFKTKAIKVDDKKAAYWFQQAAEQHFLEAQDQLASMYENGIGVTQDQEKAIYWYRRASENGSSRARSILEDKGIAIQDPKVISSRKSKNIQSLQGVHVVNFTGALRQQFEQHYDNYKYYQGVMVTGVGTGSPTKGLLLAGDLITTINGKMIKNTTDYETLPYINLAELEVLKIEVRRGDYFVDVELPLLVQDETIGKEWTAERIESGVQESEGTSSTTVDGIAEDLGEL